MQRSTYEDYLREHGISDKEIDQRMKVIETFLRRVEESDVELVSAEKDDFYRIAEIMITEGSNTIENYEAISEYFYWAGLRAQYIALTEITDCYNGMQRLAEAVEQQQGAAVRNKIFCKPEPALGKREEERCAYTRGIIGRMAELLTETEAQAAWFDVQHGIPKSYWERYDERERETAQKGETAEEFIARKMQARKAMIQRMHDENKMWFTMELTDEVLDFITREPHMKIGYHHNRKGIIITKVPYQPAKVLHAADPKMKRYYACHCPLVRDAILRDESISSIACNCSLGHASHFVAGLGVQLEGEVMESVLRGDSRCRFIFYLPDDTGNVNK